MRRRNDRPNAAVKDCELFLAAMNGLARSSPGRGRGGVAGTVRLDDRDCRPGDFGSGVLEIDTPDMKSVGDFGIPVSDSYSLELSVSRHNTFLHAPSLK